MDGEAHPRRDRELQEIGVVAHELGVPASTLRTWERRYRCVVPHRGERGQRLFDEEQVAALREVVDRRRRGATTHAAHLSAGLRRMQFLRSRRSEFAANAQASALARNEIVSLLGEDADAGFAYDLRLAISELVENAVLYGSRTDVIRIETTLFDDRAELEVENAGSLNIRSLRRKSRFGGRGLEIVSLLANAWSIDTGPGGTRFRVEISATSGEG